MLAFFKSSNPFWTDVLTASLCFLVFPTLTRIKHSNTSVIVFQILTKDSVTVAVDAVVYFRIYNATMSITNVENANRSTRLLAQTTLRNVLGTKNLSEILMERDTISHTMQVFC